MASRQRQIAGNFRKVKENEMDINFDDFQNPWNFYKLMFSNQKSVIEWLHENDLISKEKHCEKCDFPCKIEARKGKTDGFTWRCAQERGHEYGLRCNSFFEGANFTIQDGLQFIRAFLTTTTLLQASKESGLAYKSTALVWAAKIRKLFQFYVHETMSEIKFSGEIQIDESKFGKKRKYQRGSGSGVDIWIFGLIEVKSNR